MNHSAMPHWVYVKDEVHVLQKRYGGDYLEPTVEMWLKSHAQHKWKLITISQDTGKVLRRVKEGFWASTLPVLAFANADEAFAFKMRWC